MYTDGPGWAAEQQDISLQFGHLETCQNLHVPVVAESQEKTELTHF